MNDQNPLSIESISMAILSMLQNDQAVDESHDYRWKASFDFKKNINKMYYANLNDRYELKVLLENGYNEIGKIVEYLGSLNTDMNHMVGKTKIDKSNQKKDNPRIFSLMKKYQKLLTHKYFKKENLQQQKIKQNLLYLRFSQAKKQILKKYSELNGHQLTKHFQDLITNHELFSTKQGQEVVFQEIVKKISPRMNYNVYLPSMVKVILANVNWIDRENDTASLALKIEVKVNVPGIFQYPYFYEKVFKEKMKISFKTSNRSNVFNQKVKFDKKNKQQQTFQIVNDKIFKKKTKSNYYNDCGQFFQTVYKWLNYDKPTYIYHKRVQDFEGFIVDATISDIRVLLSNKNQMSPFQMIDLNGIVQLDSIVTEMKDWISILYDQEQEKLKQKYKENIIKKENQKDDSKTLKNFLIEASPKVTIKFNLISLYENKDDIQNNEGISLNHIRSFDAVECNGYKLAQNLMFLQTSNQRESRFQLLKFSKCRASYKWYRAEKVDLYQQIKNRMKKFSLKEDKVQQKIYYQQNDEAKLYEYLKILDFRFCPNKKILHNNNYLNVIEINKRFQKYFTQIREQIYNLFSPQKLQRRQERTQNQTYNPENLKYDKMQKYLPLLKSMQQANIANQIYINSQIGQEYLQKFQKIGRDIYKFAQQKYKFQKYYRRILEILISQLEDQKGLNFESQYQYLKGEQNLKGLKERLKQVIYNHNCQKLGENLANVKTDQEYHYSKAIYHFPFYKDPTPTLVLLFSSPFVLCIINLFIFFQQQELNGRLASTTALMICFIGMVAIMQKQMHSSTISSFEFLLYAMMLTPLLCLAFSIDCYLNQIKPTRDYVLSSPLFWISVIISALGILLPGIFLLIYKCHEQYVYEKNQNAQKQMQPLFLLFPGSPQVDKIIKKQQHIEQDELDDDYSLIKNINKGQREGQKKGQRKTLKRVVTSLMFKHLNSLYELRKTQQMAKRETKIKSNLHKSIKENIKFIQNTFQRPIQEKKNKQQTETVQSSTRTIHSPKKQVKNQSKHQQL